MPQNIFDTAYLPFIVALFCTALITPLVIKLSKKTGLIDDPKLHKHPGIIHAKPTPRGGGIALYLGCLIPAMIFLPASFRIVAIFFAGFLALLIGVIDDKLNASAKDVSPYLRFLINILCAVIVVASGVSITFITHPLGGIFRFDQVVIPFLGTGGILLSDIISIIWIVWVMNMLNWSKGVDGQMPGIVAISALVIGILSFRLAGHDQSSLVETQLSFIIAGASIGFLLFNFYPAAIFPGYGATALYLLLAVASILSSAKLATAILVMGVPTVDAIFTIIRRVIAKKSPFKGDNNHLHHMLLRLGYSQRQIALFYWTISAILGTISLTLQSKSKIFAIIMLVVIVGGAIFLLNQITKSKHEEKAA